MALKAVFEIKVYSPLSVLNRLQENDIIISDFREVRPYKYRFKSSKIYQKKLYKLFPDIELIADPFLIHIGKSLIKKKIGLIALILACSSFYFLSTRIYDVKIKGNDPVIGEKIIDYLSTKGIDRFSLIPNDDVIVECYRGIMKEMNTELESIEITKVGGSIYVSYEKKRSPVILPELEKNIYAAREGIVTRIEVTYGTSLVKVGDTVDKNDLLITGNFIDKDKKAQEGFAKGKVYANTWYDLQVSCKNTEIGENYGNLLKMGDELILTKDKKLVNRIVLSYEEKDGMAMMKLHYTLEENIAYFEK